MSDGTKVALVTGGGSGIGKASAAAFLADGWNVTICGRTQSKLEDAVSELDGGDRLLAQACDAADAGQVKDTVATVVERFGRLDALCNAHGIVGAFKPIEELTEEDWEEIIGVNLLGPVRFTAAAVPHLRETKGAIVNISSINATQAEEGLAGYGTAKTGLVGFTRYAASELSADGIRVNAINPGWIVTPMSEPFFEEVGLLGKAIDSNMFHRPGLPEEIASIVLFLSGPGAAYVTGDVISADGGQTVKLMPLREWDPSEASG